MFRAIGSLRAANSRVKTGLAIIGILLILAAAADLIAPADPLTQDYEAILSGPSAAHPLGTDSLGRDLAARLLYGARVSLFIAIAAVLGSVAVGVPLGAMAGYRAGAADTIIMRLADVFLAFPFALGAIAIMAVIGPGSINVVAALVVFGWPQIARVTRAQIIDEAAKDYVAAVRVVGGSFFYILRRHLLPNAAGPIAVFALMSAGTAILTEATLSFLGIGIQLPQPSWGAMLSEAVGRVTVASWLVAGPAVAVVLACLGFNLIGEGLSDALDLNSKT